MKLHCFARQFVLNMQLHTEQAIYILDKSNLVWILITLIRFIRQQIEFCLVLNQSEMLNHNPNWISFKKVLKDFSIMISLIIYIYRDINIQSFKVIYYETISFMRLLISLYYAAISFLYYEAISLL